VGVSAWQRARSISLVCRRARGVAGVLEVTTLVRQAERDGVVRKIARHCSESKSGGAEGRARLAYSLGHAPALGLESGFQPFSMTSCSPAPRRTSTISRSLSELDGVTIRRDQIWAAITDHGERLAQYSAWRPTSVRSEEDDEHSQATGP
jgi:hypothetical protein